MLVERLGVNRYSLYAEFGDKQTLFDAALARYNEAVIEPRFAPLEDPDAGLEQIRDVVEFYGSDGQRRGTGRGCLLCNTAVERAALDPGVRRHVDAYFERLTLAFRHALDNAHRAGDLNPAVDLDELSAFFTMSLIGVAAMIRAEASPALVQAACTVATSVLDC